MNPNCFSQVSGKQDNSKQTIIGDYKVIDKLQVAEKDFPYPMTFENAQLACVKLGPGWRLPTIEELHLLYLNKETIKGFTGTNYWSCTMGTDIYAWKEDFKDSFRSYEYVPNIKCRVRAVLSFK